MTITVREVAAAAGVSVGTVSNVLNRPEAVSTGVRTRVREAMATLGFVPNSTARQLRVGHSQMLAYIVADTANPFYTDVAKGIEEEIGTHDLPLFLCDSNGDPAREQTYLTLLEQQRVRGVLITPTNPKAPLLEELPRHGIPVVVVDHTTDARMHCSVAVDDVRGGQLAVAHLLDAGHERIAFIGGPPSTSQVRARRQGALNALHAANIPASDLIEIETTAHTVTEGRGAAERLAGIPPTTRPTAAFCANDMLALGVLQHCVTSGVRVPDDLAIVGYDDIDFAAAAAVPLSSVRQPRRRLGRTAAGLLMNELENPDHQHRQVMFTPELVARLSSRPLKNG